MATNGSGNTMSSGNKRKDDPVAQDVHDKLELMPLGAGNEVGRSCVYMSYKGKNVLFDCGIHPGRSGLAGLPFFDEIDPSLIDVLLVTHFHLDHSASLPYFLLKTNFKGRVFMTHATKAVYRLLLSDFVKVSKVATEDALFTEQEIAQSMDRIEVIDFHQVQEVNGIRFWCYTAGHVLGAAMFMVDIAGVRVLYTGDYSREEDRHLKAAEVPPFSPDLCVIESTFGISIHEPREERERRFVDVVTNTVLGGGRVLIPAFALGRAQELLLILDEHWRMHPELQHIPLLYASPLARKTMVVYRTYTGSMNDRIREQCEESNPFDFKFIKSLRSMAEFEDTGPAVVMASPGGLQSGLSRQLFDLWCGDHRNTCLIPGYVVEGTLAKTLLSEPKEVTLMNGSVVPLHMQIHYISFAAHADFEQTSSFLETLQPPNIVLVHGEATAMGRLRSKLMEQFKDRNTTVLMPKNCQTVDFYFKGDKIAKAVGKLTGQRPRPVGSSEGDVKAGVKSESGAPREEGNVVAGDGDGPSEEDGNVVRGVLVRKEFSYQLVAPEELSAYTHLSTGAVIQRQSIPYRGPFSAVKFRLQRMFEGVEDAKDVDWPAVSVQKGKITVGQECDDRLVMQWVSDPVSDMVADSIVSAVLQLEGARSPMRGGSEGRLEGLEEEQQEKKEVDRTEGENNLVRILLREMFGDVEELPRVEGKERLRVTMDDAEVVVVLPEGEVEGRDENLKSHVKGAVARCLRAVRPLPLS